MGNSKVGAVLVAVLVAACGSPPDAPAPPPDPAAPAPDVHAAVETALAHFDAHGARYGLAGRGDVALSTAFADDRGTTHARFRQLAAGVPVFGGEAIVHVGRDGAIEAVTDDFVRGLAPIDPKPRIAGPAGADLWVLRAKGDHLVWRVQERHVDGTDHPTMPVRFYDAHDGALVWEYDNLQTGSGPSLYSGDQTFPTAQAGTTFYMEDLADKLGTFDYRNGGTLYPLTDDDDLWDGATQRAGIDAHVGSLLTFDYYRDVHGRTGIDGASGPGTQLAADGATHLVTSKIHYSSGYNNAFWDGQTMTYGDGDGVQFSSLVAIDVTGHEMTHGVTQYTAGLVYSGESGALNESFSDVFGSMIERRARGDGESGLWKIGEDCYTPANGTDDALRYLSNPHQASNKGYTADDDPDHYSERYLGGSDNGGVHINSGISNYTFYLLAMGGTHHLGGSMVGIGADKAEQIWYRALTGYLTSGSTFAAAARGTYNAAVELYGAGSPEADAVMQAWALTGLPLDFTPPTVAIASPVDGATVTGPGPVSIAATDNIAVAAVELYADGALVGTDTTSSFAVTWNTVAAGNGPHALTAKAYDAGGNSATSATVNVTVANETTPPTVAITAPADGATVAGTVSVTASATDASGVARVDFLVDGVVKTSDFTAPYAYAWNTVGAGNGAHALTARAYDAIGNNAASAAVTVTVANDATAPTAAITAPADGATVVGTVSIEATATDNVGVARVELYVDNVLKATDTTSPYQYAWDSVAAGNGPHALVAKAYDALGNAGTSPTVTVTAANPGMATYDAARGAPTCATEGAACDSGSLAVGRGPLGPEPHQPNTLASACADGTSGGFHSDESLDRLRISSDDGQPLAAGHLVHVDATVWNYGSDYLDLYATSTASAPTWTYLTTLTPTATGASTLSTTFTLPAGAMQAIRGVFRFGGSSAACNPGPYNDHDDLVFAVHNGPDTTPPTASISSPVSGATLSGTVTVTAAAADDIGVVSVNFLVDGAIVAMDATAPYSFGWTTGTVADGPHALTAVAHDAAGNSGASPPVTVTVHNADTTPPTVSITAPANGATVHGAVTVTAAATDNVGIAGTSLYVDGALVATDGLPPFSYAWDTGAVANGAHALRVVALDGAGNAGQSAIVTVTVANPDTQPPAVVLVSPTSGATVSGSVAVTATATDNVGVVSASLYVDGLVQLTQAAPPFAWNTYPLGNGAHTLRVRAQDAAGNVGDSATVTVTVDNGVGAAVWDATLKAPACPLVRDGCDSGATLTGRGPLGPEPHAPNTLANSCGDGGTGTYHADESIDRLRVYTANGSPLAAGKTVTVEATLFFYNNLLLGTDVLDLYYSVTPGAPSWAYLATISPTGSTGTRVVSAQLALSASGTYAVRANLRRKPLLGANTPSPCTGGNYNDHDDLVFAVGP